MKDAEKAGLNKLGFRNGCGDAQQRLAGKENRSFRQRPHVARKLELREIVKKIRLHVAEERQCAEISNVFVRKAHVLQEVEGLLQACGDQIVSAVRKLAHEQLEGGAGIEAVLDVARRHGELVEVGEQPGNGSVRKHVPPQSMTGHWKR